MNGKKVFYAEWAYALGLFTLAVGTALMERADFGMSMVVAPAYLVYLAVSQHMSWFTFGMAEYCFQALLLIGMSAILRRFKLMYLFSFCTAVVYGFILDFCMWIISAVPGTGLAARLGFYASGLVCCSLGVALLFHTYIAPEAYELAVKELSEYLQKGITPVKTAYDCISCGAAVVLSFLFFGFGHFEGVKLGTIVCALINGWIIGQISTLLERQFIFKDGLPLRRFF